MANETRRRKEPTPAKRRRPTTLHDIPDHFLKRVILRLDSHLCLVRAAAVCKQWRRIAASPGVADYNFSYRYPGNYVLGYYHAVDDSSNRRAPPQPDGSLVLNPASPAPRRPLVFVPASPAINVRHFSLDFLPDAAGHRRRRWELVDGRGSLLLFADQRRGFFPDLVVCEPISRRYVRIRPVKEMKYLRCLGVFLANNSGFSRNVSFSDFRVTCLLYERSPGMADDVGEAVSCFYNRAPRSRRRITGWNTQCVVTSSCILLHGAESTHYAGRAAGLVFWVVGDDDGTVLAASIDQSGFRRYRLPEHLWGSSQPGSSFRFVEESVDVYPRLVRLVSLVGDELRVYLGNLYNSSEWQLERTLQMSQVTRGLKGYKECFFATTVKIVGEGPGYVVMTPAEEETWLFSLDLRTMRVECDHSRNRLPGKVYTYELETPPVVRACVVRCKRFGRGPLWRGLGRCSHICICA
ncbi:hypothetical protein EJB05_55470, partial [Eragrostis curvula]